jgi:hypothetical protein
LLGYEDNKEYKRIAILCKDKQGNLVPNIKEITTLIKVEGPFNKEIRSK